MEKHNIPHLEAKVKELQEVSKSAGDTSDLVELLTILHRPGWTTLAEYAFAVSLVDSAIGQTRNVLAQRKALLAGSREVQSERTATA